MMNEQAPRPIRRRTLFDEAVAGLRELILSGRLAPGERLVEAELCESFAISRTPLRQALKLLETEGLVTLHRNRGAYVCVMTAQEVAELFEVVSDLERLAVRLAVERMSDADLERLEKRHERMMRHYRAGKRRPCFDADYAIHNYIVEKSGNSLLVSTHATLMARARRERYRALFSQERWDEAMSEHEAFMAAILARDSEEAGRLMYEHVMRTGRVLQREIQNAGSQENRARK